MNSLCLFTFQPLTLFPSQISFLSKAYLRYCLCSGFVVNLAKFTADLFTLMYFWCISCGLYSDTTLRPRQNGWHCPDGIFKCMFGKENVWILIKISLKFVPKGPINNIPALFQIMAWCRSSDKPLSEPMMVSLPTHICVTLPQSDTCCPHYVDSYIRGQNIYQFQ